MIFSQNNRIIIDCEKASLEDKNEFEKAVAKIIHAGHKEILIDLGKTTYLPSELMGFMMWKKKELGEAKIQFTIDSISSSLKRLFDNAMLSDFFEISSKTKIL